MKDITGQRFGRLVALSIAMREARLWVVGNASRRAAIAKATKETP